MIKTETMTINGISFVRTYSDTGHRVERDGVAYDEAIDPADTGRTYTESSEMVGADEESDADYAEAGRIMMGVSE